ncbi:putative PucR family transcriptional regulator [Fictibacillus macauensis ZFHKF-1]|uniref:Putative PucR family transcriptional regulator n=1 Tax=Fictibacillus macauensis ZFHKF-1 TaxID=1196324 RepID=I8IW09_9BACL|nr:helix-turn-helix domain-containing protein [Fictibacillus macauensis]EIT83666.1 putative PucR family transcriptional regulator [Fictibacillus macauensis ZFHKF-1]
MKSIEDPFKGTFGSLENLADAISEVLHCPVTIEDANHRLLAYSTHEDSTDPARIATIIGRRVPEKVINSLWKDGAIPALQKSDEPVRVSSISKVGLGNRVAVSIRKKTEILGYIWVLEVDRHLSEHDLELLKKGAAAAKNQLLQLQTGSKRKQESRQEFFWKLLTNDSSSDLVITNELRELGLLPTVPIAVLLLRFPEDITPAIEKNVSYILSVSQSIRFQLMAIDEQDMILLAAPAKKEVLRDLLQDFITSFLQQMQERFGVEQIVAGYGGIYEHYSQTNQSYLEAQRVLHIKQRFGGTLTDDLNGYEQLGIYQFLDGIYEQQRKSSYRNRSLEKLRQYDREHHTNLMETLRVYLGVSGNSNKAAEQLHIHLNTLTYRLKRMSEIASIDFTNTNQKMMLYLDLTIEQLFFDDHL